MSVKIAPVLLALFLFFLLAVHAAVEKEVTGINIGNCYDESVPGYVANCDADCKKLKFRYGRCTDYYCRCHKMKEAGKNIGDCRDKSKPGYVADCKGACKALGHTFGVCSSDNCGCYPPNL